MGFLTDHPYTAITVTIDRLVTDQFEEDDVAGIFDLTETIRLSSTGPTEAARALRKKLKYGSVHNQLRALTILDSLIENGGKRFQTSFADEPLLERLRIVATDPLVDSDVRKKAQFLFRQWAANYKDVTGMNQVVRLYQELPRKKRAPPKPQRFEDPEEDLEDDDSPPPPKPQRPSNNVSGEGSSHSRDHDDRQRRYNNDRDEDEEDEDAPKRPARRPTRSVEKKKTTSKSSAKPFDVAKEKPKLIQTLAESGTAATNLQNALKLINREEKLATDDIRATECFNKCRQLRRLVLRYIQHIESEDYIGSLIHANEELVTALQLYDKMSQPIEDDSDSEHYESEDDLEVETVRNKSNSSRRSTSAHAHQKSSEKSHRRVPSTGTHHHVPTAEELAHKRKPPPIPLKREFLHDFKTKAAITKKNEEEGDPFGDTNKIETPAIEKSEPVWKAV
ncbi:hypothetical protein V1514DRAFT_280283 [Lipomyces japonicus]|uniref:uncharacterized protein n=1 Tax=Lipomyces japonicus TaxID=56871 RepID=UPI0034CEBB23